MATRVKAGSFHKRVYVPPRASRVEGEFPVYASRTGQEVMDVDQIEDVVPSYIPKSRVKPHLFNEVKPTGHSTGPDLDDSRLRNDNPPNIAQFTEKDMGTQSLSKSTKIRWLPNPFLPNNDLRQGGPLFYAKHFTDRNRLMDENIVRDQLDSIKAKEEDEGVQKRGRRSRAFWQHYRPIPLSSIEAIDSFDKLSKILANEVHLHNKSSENTSSKSLEALQSRFRILLETASSPTNRDQLVSIIKCVHQFGVYNNVDDMSILNPVMNLVVSPESRKMLKPVNYIYMLQAMARLKYRDHRLLTLVDYLALCWGTVGQKEPLMLIRGANAISVLDLVVSSPFTKGLKDALAELIPKLTVSQLERIKAITMIQLFDELMILDYFVMCSEKKIRYKRHMILLYLYHRENDSVTSKIPGHVKEWIEMVVRENCDTDDENDVAVTTTSSNLHGEIEKCLANNFPHIHFVSGHKFGPLTLDTFIPSLNLAFEACCEFQFYSRTSKLTAEARLRHELIRSLGIKSIPITHFNWKNLNTRERIQKLRSFF